MTNHFPAKKINPIPFQKTVLDWFDLHGRKTLPWQEDKTPYRVWVSEIMLQQTQVSTVIPYFQRFMATLPTIEALALAPDDQVLHLWTGLGYYTRARNLHRAAKIVVTDFHGKFPNTLETLQLLPGIGRSTAGAILAIAFQQQAAILDGNVKRVLTRLTGVTEWPGEKNVMAQLWNTAELLTPEKRTADYTQAMMDIGATVCVRGKPHCNICPLQSLCIAHTLGIEKTIPQAKPKKQLRVKQVTLLILQHDRKVLLQKRPPTGIWGGLWTLPEMDGWMDQLQVETFYRQHYKLTGKLSHFGDKFRHTFSHFHLDILPVFIQISRKPTKIMDSAQQIWYNLHQSPNIGLPAPIKKMLENLNHAHDPLCET